MHYAFDKWMDREFPGCPFERFANDIVAHCDSEDQARVLRAQLAERLGPLGLELHPDNNACLTACLQPQRGSNPCLHLERVVS
jgi:hypothetical protein